MNFNTLKMLLSEVGPARLTKKYDYESACEDMEQINLLLRRRAFRIRESDGLKIYTYDTLYGCNKFYKHFNCDAKLIPMIKKIFMAKIKRYTDWLSEYYTEIYGEPFIDGKRTTWYKLYSMNLFELI